MPRSVSFILKHYMGVIFLDLLAQSVAHRHEQMLRDAVTHMPAGPCEVVSVAALCSRTPWEETLGATEHIKSECIWKLS
jgi:hypothetical protein